MPDPPRSTEPGGIPRWVRISGIVVIVVVLLVAVMLLIGGGHRPRRHAPSDGPGGQAPLASVAASGGIADHGR
jgi:hypothetical protein